MKEKLKSKIEDANDLYREGKPTGLSDIQYDVLVEEYRKEYGDDLSIDQDISHNDKNFLDYTHTGIQNTLYSIDELKGDIGVLTDAFASLKYDGLTSVLFYDEIGVLIKVTTGGRKGVIVDVTETFKYYFPELINQPKLFNTIITGEVYTTFSATKEIGQASARSTASGKLLSFIDIEKQPKILKFIAFNCINTDTQKLDYSNVNTYMNNNFFGEVLVITKTTDFEILEEIYQSTRGNNSNIPLDGLVMSIGNEMYKVKFTAENNESVILDIIHQVGASGAITPVAVVKPFEDAQGNINDRVSLHNYVLWSGVEIGDTLLLSKRGDVINTVDGYKKAGSDIVIGKN